MAGCTILLRYLTGMLGRALPGLPAVYPPSAVPVTKKVLERGCRFINVPDVLSGLLSGFDTSHLADIKDQNSLKQSKRPTNSTARVFILKRYRMSRPLEGTSKRRCGL